MTNDLPFHTGKITLEPNAGIWSAAFEFAPPSVSDKASRGVLLAAIDVISSEGFDASLAGRQVLSVLQETYYVQATGGILQALERAVLAAHNRLITLVFSGEEQSVDFDIVAGVMWGNVFYLAQLGDARAVIRRAGELKLIGHRSGVDSGDLAVGDKPDIRTASGMIEEGDRIILATPRLFEVIPADEINRSLAAGSADEVTVRLVSKLKDEPAAAAIVLITGQATSAATILPPDLNNDMTPPGEELDVVEPEVATPAAATETDLSDQVGADIAAVSGWLSTLQDRAKPVLSRAIPLAKSAATNGHHLARTGIWPRLRRTSFRFWEMLGSPRTALETVQAARNRRTLLALAAVLLLVMLGGISINALFRHKAPPANPTPTAESTTTFEATNLYKVDPQLFFDLTIIRPGASGAALAGTPTTLYVLDGTGGIYSLTTADKKTATLSSDLALNKGQSLAQVGNFLFAYVPGQGLYGYDLKTRKLAPAKLDSAWGKITALASYTSFLYLVDSGKNAIWRYAPTAAAQLGPYNSWLKGSVDLSGATSAVVDGSVWVGQGGSILKLTQGSSENFATAGVTPQLSNIKAIYTTIDQANLYVLEPGRLVVLDKTGTYLAQYTSDKLQVATGLVVDETGKKAYILAGKDIYLLELH